MCTIGLISKSNRNTVTAVPNRFIDEFMAEANGTYVKIYLYLLRHLDDDAELSVPGIAELLDCTEKFLRKGLDYWTKQGLMEYSVSPDGTVESISLVDLSGGSLSAERRAAKARENVKPQAAEAAEPAFEKTRAVADLNSLSEDENVPFILSSLESYFERPLSREETDTALYIYSGLGFSCDLLLFLYEQCIEKGKTAPKYITKVAIGWHEEGITNVDEAKEYLLTRGEAFFAVRDEFGLTGNLGASQLKYLKTWVNEWHLSKDLIREACSRAMLRKGPSFQYANSILKDWHEAGATMLSDIEKIDLEHKLEEDAKHKPKTPAKSTAGKANRFENFTQRDYSPEAMAEIEKRMRAKK